jgi:Recombinase
VQIRWRSGVLTKFAVKRPTPGEGSLKTPQEAVAKIHEMASEYTYGDIAQHLNDAGYRTAFGRPFTHQHVGYICRRDGVVPNRERHQRHYETIAQSFEWQFTRQDLTRMLQKLGHPGAKAA